MLLGRPLGSFGAVRVSCLTNSYIKCTFLKISRYRKATSNIWCWRFETEIWNFRNNRSQTFCKIAVLNCPRHFHSWAGYYAHRRKKIAVLKNFAIFTGKHLCWSLFLIKLQPWRTATLLKIDSNMSSTGVFLWKLWNFSEELFL